MKSLLDALQEGRLIELPESDKAKSLQYLGTLIEAIPDFRTGLDFNGAVMTREAAANTGIGMGWACPHGRVSGDGDLLCAIGWSPTGIDYGGPDGKPVRIVVMHYIPDSQKNTYLREISMLAKAIKNNPALVVDCWAPWCGPCRMMSPVIDELATDLKGKITFGKLNTDENQDIAIRYQVQAIPTLLIFKDGKLADRKVGALPKKVLEGELTKYN